MSQAPVGISSRFMAGNVDRSLVTGKNLSGNRVCLGSKVA
ncbi:unnamed protein product [Fusarium venenatum]|uniref:Uncharacterized protein n=1 Tax=Fusarium venenatum TaxID=56646 RepID=A0A2L2TH19_9HYPO|nr:uncharacterized protein FVRRES_03815 [Fusarium venenatum]CEI67303.1 unnamed protein product [Fusarium venenatum]